MDEVKQEIRIDSSNLKATVGEVEYYWFGGFGAVVKSYENGIKQGDTRVIGGVVFYACSVYGGKWWRKNEVCWIPQFRIEFGWIREFKKKLFSIKAA